MGDKSVSDAEWILQLTFRFRGDGSFGRFTEGRDFGSSAEPADNFDSLC